MKTQEMVASALLDIRAVHYNETTPFVLTSGTRSPVYVDCRKLISFPRQRSLVISLAAMVVQDDGAARFDCIAGGETAGIPLAAWLSHELSLPMIYVRKQAKGFGRNSQIEGELKPGASVLLIEDLLFDAQSKLNFAAAIRDAGARVEHTVVVFDYGNDVSRRNLSSAGIHLYALTNWSALLQVAVERSYFTERQAGVIRSFLRDPAAWGSKASSEVSEATAI